MSTRITPEEAQSLVDTLQYEHQRAVRKHHVNFLEGEMRRGDFIQDTQIRIAVLGNTRYLVDGQHRLHAVIQSGMSQCFQIVETHVRDSDELANLYGRLDVGMKRTAADLYRSLDLSEKYGITKSHINHLSAAITFMRLGCKGKGPKAKVHQSDMLHYMEMYMPYVHQFVDITMGCEQSITFPAWRTATLAVVLLSLRFSQPLADQRGDPSVVTFWKGAIFDDGIQVGDPRKVVNRHLLTTSLFSGQKNTAVTSAYSCRYIINCFNGYMERRELRHTKVYDAHAPIVMYGAPTEVDDWFQD